LIVRFRCLYLIVVVVLIFLGCIFVGGWLVVCLLFWLLNFRLGLMWVLIRLCVFWFLWNYWVVNGMDMLLVFISSVMLLVWF